MNKRSFKNEELLLGLDWPIFRWLQNLWTKQKTVEEVKLAFKADQRLTGILLKACRVTQKRFPRKSKKLDVLEGRIHMRLDCRSGYEVVALMQSVIDDLHEIFDSSRFSHAKRIKLHKDLRHRLKHFNALIKRAYGVRVVCVVICGKYMYLHTQPTEGESGE